MKSVDPKLYQHTPTVIVHDNRGLTVREISYHRTTTEENADTRITRHQYDVHGHLSQSIDPRLYDAWQEDNTVKPNFLWQYDLTGNILRTESVDAGCTVTLHDIESRPVLTVTATGVKQTRQYEDNSLPGRLLFMTEQEPKEGESRITEHLIWAGNTQEEKDQNLAGQCVHHYDTAGRTQLNSLSLTGNVLSQSRQLLIDGQDADWPGDDKTLWVQKLSSDVYTTQHKTDATGALLTQTDAEGNIQRLAYDVAGQLKGSWLTVKGQNEQVIIRSLTYSAAGQKLREEHGNGIITEYAYEPETQRLIGIKTSRLSDTKVLQDLRYEYDPVGNVINIRNDTEATRFWRNQKVVPENSYTYDSLYQLISTTGREMANISQQSDQLPSPALPSDNNTYTNYTRTYTYDPGGNLTQIRHSSPVTQNSYTTDITVSNRSNRAVLSTLTTDPALVDAFFEASGHQKTLLPGQNLNWNARGELQQVTPMNRKNVSDQEWYRYGSDGIRMLKVSEQQTQNSTQQQRVVYLPGLELRTTQNSTTTTENLQVIIVGEAGRAQVRTLHWETTPPKGINNNQLRYSYDNLIGSSQLELDSDGQIISQEEYYPFGGTALWAARSQTEASYKTIRYSGKERDATGLYYYGYRYYQPWAGRWLSADPAGTIDGLNLYCMVMNNPVTLADNMGLSSLDWLDLAIPQNKPDIPPLLYKQNPKVAKKYQYFTKSTGEILQEAERNEGKLKGIKQKDREKTSRKMMFTNAKLKGYAAHAGIMHDTSYKDKFLNLSGSLGAKNTFPGVQLTSEKAKPGFEQYHPSTLKTSKRWRPNMDLGSYRVANEEQFISGIKKAYQESGTALHPLVEQRIKAHIKENNNILPKMAGIAGLHAEVQALNYMVTQANKKGENISSHLNSTYIFTQRLVGDKNQDFPACHNCSGILSGMENVMTGRVENYRRMTRRNSVA
ncbi:MULTISPECIES: RHS repeat-associated core domain-containing protein [Photorhabdus]|uniref:Toxin n=1 Tax=Photorhabdus thracensis TaxID=230089 RepID=A0A0F7LM29_9GAMM|nr:RHS repeat-associated core domain-containing protein [Photorhabdus thracensis]AKH64254.1 toxin [Photorhabdus thracensis]MCC8422808.1 RHS repeat protein [Photorhabdus thracensis]